MAFVEVPDAAHHRRRSAVQAGRADDGVPRAAAAGDHARLDHPDRHRAAARGGQTEGLLTEPVPEYAPNTQVADAPSTVVELQADRASVPHQADALGFVPDAQGDPDSELTPERQHLLASSTRPRDLPATVGADELGPDDVWAPDGVPVAGARPADPSTIDRQRAQADGRAAGRRGPASAWPTLRRCAIGSGEVLAATLAASEHADVLHRGRRDVSGQRGRSAPRHRLPLISASMGELWESRRGRVGRDDPCQAGVVGRRWSRHTWRASTPSTRRSTRSPRCSPSERRPTRGSADAAVAAGGPLGRLHGVPFTVKHNLDLVGSATTQGVPALAEAVPPMDSPVVERMKAAGAIPLARTNLPDMGLRVHTESGLFGLTRNPWDLGRTAGGSSGGEAVALATGMSPIGLGNDIGGSLRNPATHCGIASLKPSAGVVPSCTLIPAPDGPASFQLMPVDGPMARHIADVRLGLDVLAGRHPRDPYSVPRRPDPGTARTTGRCGVALLPSPPGGSTASRDRGTGGGRG